MLTFFEVTGLVYVVNDPELQYTPNETAVATFSVAANRKWTNEGGTKHEESCFIECTVWAKLAELVSESVHRGDPLYIFGALKQDTWEKDGQKHSKHTLTLSRVVFLKPKE